MGSLSVPIIDISGLHSSSSPKERGAVVGQIGRACFEWGFFYVVNHGVDLSLVTRATSLGHGFFNMPKQFKDRVARREDNFQGYSDSELTKQKVDWKQVFDFTPEIKESESVASLGVHGQNQWPDIPQFQTVMQQYLQEMQTLSKKLMVASLESLTKEIDCVQFTQSCFPHSEETSVCRLNYYPKCPDPSLHLGVGPHSDPGILTILLQDQSITSLQVERDGKFYDIPPVQDSFVINIGDMMQVWSNGKYKAPVHRVLANHDKDRFSLPFFLAPAYATVIAPLEGTGESKRYKDIHWGHFRKARYEGDYANRGEEIQIAHFEIK